MAMTGKEIKQAMMCHMAWRCGECPYQVPKGYTLPANVGRCDRQLLEGALDYIEQLEARCANTISASDFLGRLHEGQAHAVINGMTESKAAFDISIAIVEQMVKESESNDN